jgi:ATP adenylyltransferase
MLNRYPYTNCHLLIAPRKHTNALDRLSAEESLNLFTTLSKSVNALNKSIKPDGFNIGMNLGRIAGAGVKGHLHFHIVPRWNGDTNFMPILAESVVVPEHLEKAYDKLLPFFEKF